MIWSRGVDTELFRPRADKVLDLPMPIFLYVGRLAVEKNVDGFLRLDLPGSKVVVGDGPERARLQRAYPEAVFLGAKVGSDLAAIYASSDVFVFPSRTDTYGIVLLEALASGLPIAALPVPGPLNVVGDREVGVLADNLAAAALSALSIPKEVCRAFALRHTWSNSAEEFLACIAAANTSEFRLKSSARHLPR
jgi:glycosyltransferase involved in cell wall biosynthesis